MHNFLPLTFFLFLSSFGLTQNTTISGILKDSQSGETLIGATIFVNELKLGASTNVYGFYSLTIPSGSYTITFHTLVTETLLRR
jgi:hypothetical protein